MTAGPTCHPDMLTFWRMPAEGVCTGQPLLPLLRSMGDALAPQPMGEPVKALADSVASGRCLSQAMSALRSTFTEAHVCFVRSGEHTGRPDRALPLVLELTWSCPACGALRFPDGAAEERA